MRVEQTTNLTEEGKHPWISAFEKCNKYSSKYF